MTYKILVVDDEEENMGCTDYLSKPVDMKYLKELIKKELGGRG